MRDYTFDRMPISSISGRLNRQSDVYYRTINGKTYAYLFWNPNTKPPTTGTLRTRQIFKTASLYTSLDMRLPFKLDEWKRRMDNHNRLAVSRNPDYARHPENYNKHNDPEHKRPYTSVRYFILAFYTHALTNLIRNRPRLTLTAANRPQSTLTAVNHPRPTLAARNRPQPTTEMLTPPLIRLNLFSNRHAPCGRPPI